jgi:NAD(P)-dependent dehydrogenase (short-subunit alcohol dehydrogenase family)
MNSQLKGKKALIIGGGSGIGKSVATIFAEHGAVVMLVGRSQSKLDIASKDIKEKANVDNVETLSCNLSILSDVQTLASFAKENFGTIDLIVNSAGVHAAAREFNAISPNDWDFILSNNTTGLFNLLHVFVPVLRLQGYGHLINISSIAATKPSVLAGAAYTASKHAANGLINTVALEETKNGLRFSTVSPGPTNTPLVNTRATPPTIEEKMKLLPPEEVAKAVLFVASLPANAYVEELILKPVL